MIFHKNYWLVVFAFLISTSIFPQFLSKLPISRMFIPQSVTADEAKTYIIHTDAGFLINNRIKWSSLLRISFKKGKLSINGIQFSGDVLEITPEKGEFTFRQQEYSGSLYIKYKNNAWHLFQIPKSQNSLRYSLDLINHEACSKNAVEHSDPSREHKYQVRVLLAQEEKKNLKEPLTLNCKNGFIVFDPVGLSKHHFKSDSLNIMYTQKNGLSLNKIPYGQSRLYIIPTQEFISFKDREYQGNFLVVLDQEKIYLINVLDLEDYVFSVLKTESWPGWPLEVNKVFAIASRSYVIGVILDTKKSGLPYHVKNTNKHQTYTGLHTNHLLKDAVQQTQGIFIAYKKKPIVAMFDACCGGIIPAHVHGVNFTHAPYLARSYACTFCKSCKIYNWQAEYSLDQLEKHLKKEIPTLQKLKEVKIMKIDKAGLVQEVHAKTSAHTHTITGKKIYSLLDKVRSFCFTVAKKTNNTIVFTGRGYGHHMGLCQWGAREMVRRGHDYKAVLHFYYPHTDLMRLV